MIRMKKSAFASKLPLNERSMPEIKFSKDSIPKEAKPDSVDKNEILDVFELLYEVEYKYSTIKNNRFTGVPRRRENILSLLEDIGREAVSFLADTFEVVFREWLDNHALTDPDKWARQRFYEDGESLLEMEGLTAMFEIILVEMGRYTGIISEKDLFLEMNRLHPELLEDLLDELVRAWREQTIEEIEEGELDSALFSVQYSINIPDFEITDEFKKFIENHFAAYDEDFIGLFGDKDAAATAVIEDQIDALALSEDLGRHKIPLVDTEKFFLLAYRDILFPAWYDYWSSQGIDETRDRVERVYEDIVNIEKRPLDKQFMVLNIAKNTNHQNGSMMEYYSDMWRVRAEDLARLSDMDTTEWEKELESIGVEL